jgi:4-amino-4-deoxy-L-arabinose transferase-like glycosyltransferase
MANLTNIARNWRMRVISIVAIALLLRVSVVAIVAKSHSVGWFFGQTTELGLLAESLRTGHGLSSPFGGATGPSAFLSPGYPMIVAGVFAIFGPYSFASEAAMMSLQTIFGAATVLVIMLLTRRIFGIRAATIAGLTCALCPPALFLPTLFWETSLSVLLAAILFALAFLCAEERTMRNWIWLGIASAIALLVNPSLLSIVLCLFAWAVYRTRSRSLLGPATCILLCVALSTPWAMRNSQQLHTFIPLRSNLGYELWQGNRPGSDGFFLADLHPNVNAVEFQRYKALGEVGYMHEKLVIAKDHIAADPGWFLAHTAKRMCYFWVGIGRQSSSLVVAYITGTTILGFAGLVILWRRSRAMAAYFLVPLMLYPVPYYITHPDFRFRLVIDPILVALAAYALSYRRPILPAETYGATEGKPFQG